MSLWPRWYRPPVPPRLPLDQMLRTVAAHYGVTVSELKGQGRNAHLTNGRSVIAKILRERGLSYPVIARLIGRGDHTTAMHLIATFADRAEKNPDLACLYEAFRVHEAKAERWAA